MTRRREGRSPLDYAPQTRTLRTIGDAAEVVERIPDATAGQRRAAARYLRRHGATDLGHALGLLTELRCVPAHLEDEDDGT